jgi:hypothetical protein
VFSNGMGEVVEDNRSRRIRVARTLGLSMETIKRLGAIELELPFTAESPGEQHTSCYGPAGDDVLMTPALYSSVRVRRETGRE